MLFGDSFQTIAKATEGSFKDRGSKFLAFALPVRSEEEARKHIRLLQKEHFSSAHCCWALRLGASAEYEKSNDDREPANSAGKPILRVIQSKGLSNILVVVVRYFGGKLLGIPGLINAYSNAAADALANATIVEEVLTEKYLVQCAFEQRNDVFRVLKQFELRILKAIDIEDNSIIFEVRRSLADKVIRLLKEQNFKTSLRQ